MDSLQWNAESWRSELSNQNLMLVDVAVDVDVYINLNKY